MRTRRLAIAGLGLVAALAVGVAGCDSVAGGDSASGDGTNTSVEQKKPIDALNEAGQKLNSETFKLEMVMPGGMEADGVVDAPNKKASMTMAVSFGGSNLKTEVIMLSKDFYVKVSGVPGAPNQWMHLDASKANADSPLGMINMNDPSGYQAWSGALVSVEYDGERAFKGTIDLTKSPTADEATLETLGDKAKEVPFTAKVDGEGRLVELVIDLSAIEPSLKAVKTRYFDFGTQVDVEAPPASETIEAPAELLDALSG